MSNVIKVVMTLDEVGQILNAAFEKGDIPDTVMLALKEKLYTVAEDLAAISGQLEVLAANTTGEAKDIAVAVQGDTRAAYEEYQRRQLLKLMEALDVGELGSKH